MASSQQPDGRDGVISTLDVFIQVLNIARGACGIPPAQVAFGSAGVLLAMIRVRSPLSYEDELPRHVHLGHDGQQSRLCRAWAGLRESMPSALREIEGKAIGRTQPVCPRCDWRSD